jgi:Caspase domain
MEKSFRTYMTVLVFGLFIVIPLHAKKVSTPTTVRATKHFGKIIKVTWVQITAVSTTLFYIYRSESKVFSSSNKISDSRGTLYIDDDKTLKINVKYYYWITEVNASTKKQSEPSLLDDYGQIIAVKKIELNPATNPTTTPNKTENANYLDKKGQETYGASIEHPKKALVIGVAKYKYVDTLLTPIHDARKTAALLRDSNWYVMGREDLETRASFEKVIKEFLDTLQTGDIALFFYSGHGIQYKGQNYLVPISAKINDESDILKQTYPLDLLMQQLAQKCQVRIMVMDACKSGNFAAYETIAGLKKGLQSIDNEYIKQLDQQNGGETLIAYSNDTTQAAHTNYSAFTGALHDVLKQNTCISLEEAFYLTCHKKEHTPKLWKMASSLSSKILIKKCQQ